CCLPMSWRGDWRGRASPSTPCTRGSWPRASRRATACLGGFLSGGAGPFAAAGGGRGRPRAYLAAPPGGGAGWGAPSVTKNGGRRPGASVDREAAGGLWRLSEELTTG